MRTNVAKRTSIKHAKQRFEEKVFPEPNTGCWIWAGYIDSQTGYGGFTAGVSFGKISAHRFSYLIHKGEIPKGLFICHSCDNRWCVNPDHLFAGTQKENIIDMISKGRLVKSIGVNSGAAKLNDENVISIRKLKGLYSQRELAKMYGVAHATIGTIHRGKNWKHLDNICTHTL